MRFQMDHIRRTLLLFLILLGLGSGIAKGQGLGIAGRALAWGGSCAAQGIIAGSSMFIIVYNSADEPLQVLVPGWPEGYSLEAALDFQAGDVFMPTPGLIQQLNPEYYLSKTNRFFEGYLKEGVTEGIDTEGLNQKDFVLTIPEHLVGHTITFRARYDRGVNLISGTTHPIGIISPCDANDEARIMASRIYAATKSLDNERATALGDSMLECGLSDAGGWYYASMAARQTLRYDKALVFTEKLWQDFGMIRIIAGESYPSRPNRNSPRDPELQRVYNNIMNTMRQMQAEHEQLQR